MLTTTVFNDARRLFASGQFSESLSLLNRAEKEGCNPVSIGLDKGAALMALRDFGGALRAFDHVLGIDTDNERAFYFRGLAHLNLGQFGEAVWDLSRAIRLNPKRGAAFLARGIAYGELGLEDEATRDFKAASAFSAVEVGRFGAEFGNARTMFDRSMALVEGERGPLRYTLTDVEIERLEDFIN